jgi:hypothetical protein
MPIDIFSSWTEATEKQVRAHYKASGYEVRITKHEGHVRYRPANRSKRETGAWREGRYVTDYIVVDGQVVLP